MSSPEERLQILEMVAQGRINADEGAQLLAALDQLDFQGISLEEAEEAFGGDQLPLEEQPPSASAETEASPPDLDKWRRWWTIPFWIGTGIAAFSSALLYLGSQRAWAGFWMVCLWLPLLFGLTVIGLAWFSRGARWLHIRVQQKEGEWPQRIAISFPLPLRLTAWSLRIFGHLIPGLDSTGLDEVILALGKATTPEAPLYVEVDEGVDGERVQVYIG